MSRSAISCVHIVVLIFFIMFDLSLILFHVVYLFVVSRFCVTISCVISISRSYHVLISLPVGFFLISCCFYFLLSDCESLSLQFHVLSFSRWSHHLVLHCVILVIMFHQVIFYILLSSHVMLCLIVLIYIRLFPFNPLSSCILSFLVSLHLLCSFC